MYERLRGTLPAIGATVAAVAMSFSATGTATAEESQAVPSP
ncbi:hypothetical protein AB0K86_23840 [Streptomyces clavifer]|nr:MULTISPECIES: hypothetical protein [unclassified Streptomyces]MDX3061456.1 hypothetical protein [Streptomyces sp. ND04-05B]